MRLTKFAHAGVRLESEQGVLIFDPSVVPDQSTMDTLLVPVSGPAPVPLLRLAVGDGIQLD